MILVLSIVSALALTAAGWLFRLTSRVCAEMKQVKQAQNDIVIELEAELDKVKARFDAWDAQRREQAEWAAQTESLNLNKPGQVLRLHRRGDSALDIARSLQMAPGEVALIIKVHDLQKKPHSSNESSR